MKRMTTKTGDGVNSDSLRARAEELLRANPPSIDPNAPEHVQALVYELYLTQVELKLQVEDWRQAKEAAEHSRNRYQELYDHAPVGYLTLDETGLIVEANTMSTELLGQERDVLKGQDLANFIAPDSQVLFRAFMKNVTQTAMHKTCELRLKRTDGSVLDAQLECRAEKDPKHEVPSLHMTIIDITPLKQVEQRLRNINDTLERRVAQAVGYTKLLGDVACIANESDTVDEAFTACLELICGHVGWSGSHIWMVSQNQITDSGIWSSSPSQAFSAIIKATSAIVERERLPELWAATESRKPASITDPQDDPRNQAIRSAGFAATLLLPVLAGHRVVAVLEFFLRPQEQPDTELLSVLEQAGMQMGRLLERKEAEVALRESEQRFRAVFDNAPVGIALGDLDGRPIITNQAIQTMVGCSAEQLRNASCKEFLHLHDAERGQTLFDELTAGERDSYDTEVRYYTSDSQTRWARVHVRLLRCPSGWPSYTMSIVEDITERRELERAVAELTVQEQKKILGYLHDDLGQQLTGIGYVAKSLQHKLEARSISEADSAAELVTLIVKTHDQLRLLVAGLGPVDAEVKTLPDTLAQLAASTTELSGIPCAFTCPSPIGIEDTNAATQLSYIAQEAVAGALQGGTASYIRISLNREGGTVVMTIDHDGTGRSELRNQESIGRRIMRYRAGLIGADLDITSTEEKGTEITCVLRGEAYESGE